MRIRTFQGRSMAEALASVKRQYGRHAVILSTRTRTRGGLFGIGAKSFVEITAARDLADLPVPLRGAVTPSGAPRNSVAHRGDSQPEARSPAASTLSGDALVTEITSLKSMVSDLLRESRRNASREWPEGLYDAYAKLIENAVAEDIADQLVASVRESLSSEQLSDPECVRRALAEAMCAMVPTAGPIATGRPQNPRVIALVGPTGVGKTTTVAKLAANLALRENRKVGLITIDTYRIAAVEQLRTYAQIINVPLAVAAAPRQMTDILASMSDRHVILIDTAGRSQRDTVKIKELSAFFAMQRPDEVHLVLSTTCSERVLSETIDRFTSLGVDRIIFTKLDEAVGFGVVLKCLQKANARLSYVTTGQDVPDHIEVGDSGRLVDLMIGTGRAAETPAPAL